jgi:putative ATP-dependent endonuclease of the OLD family
MMRARIRNYRCLDDVTVKFSNITTLIGPNGAGKSSILRALEWFFNGKSSDLTEDDVRVGATQREITVEVDFDELTPEDRAALGSARGARVSIGRSWDGGSDRMWMTVPGSLAFAHIREPGLTAMDKRERYSRLRTEQPEYELPSARSSAEVDQNLLAWEDTHPDLLEDQDVPCPALFGFGGQAKLSGLFDYVFVSADLRAADEARDVRSSIVGRILEQAIDRSDAESDLAELGRYMVDQHTEIQIRYFARQLEELSRKMSDAVAELTRGRKITVEPVLPEFKPPPIQFTVKVADGPAATRVDQQGHGFRRALLISALQLLAQATAASGNRQICLAIEEPELFQHPVQARAFASVLRKLGADPERGVQITYATHSPFFLEAEGFPEIRRVARHQGDRRVAIWSTTLRAVTDRLAGTVRPENVGKQLSGVLLDRLPEAVFASAVILTEGGSDGALLEGCALRGESLDVRGIVAVEAGSKESIPIAHAILSELGIPGYVMFDADAGAGDRAAARGGSREQAERSSARANRRLLGYLGATVEDHPATQVTETYAVLTDTLEPFLQSEWPEWEQARQEIIQSGRGASGKHAATYRLAALEAVAPPPRTLVRILEQVGKLAPEE